MDLFPRARRVLLTAYADTEAAISAINVVDLDHYLLKPWDPPEEKLYPVVDACSTAWRDSPGPAVGRDRAVVGHRWSARSYELREFLARNQVPYRWSCAPTSPRAPACSRPPARIATSCRWSSPRTATALVAAHRRRGRRGRGPLDHAPSEASTTSS